MTRDEFMDKLERELAARRVPEPEDILAEYRRHFEYKLADGYSEEETAARLGDPAELAAQFEPGEAEQRPGRGGSAARSALTWTGLIFADMFVLSFFAVFASWVLAVACTALASGLVGLCRCGDDGLRAHRRRPGVLARLGLVPISTKVFARLLQKAAESRGGASGRAPQSAECPYPHKSAGGGQGGDPRRGSPPIIVLIGAKSSGPLQNKPI